MSKLDTRTEYTFPAPTSTDYHIVDWHKDVAGKTTTSVIMTYITEEEEKEIDNLKSGFVKIKRGDAGFKINHNNIYCYGEVDFHNKSDIDTIKSFNFLNYLGLMGAHVRSGYDYDSHVFKSKVNRLLWTETWDPSYLCKIAHGALGKPERIVLFKLVYDTVQKKRSR